MEEQSFVGTIARGVRPTYRSTWAMSSLRWKDDVRDWLRSVALFVQFALLVPSTVAWSCKT